MGKVNYSMKDRKRSIGAKLGTIAATSEFSPLRKVLLSLIIICLASAAAIGATSALFSGKTEAGTHIVTGNLDFEFKRTNLVGEVINEKGFLDDYSDTTDVDLKTSGANAFNITEMVPGATYTGTFYLKNIGTTAFDANISFVNLQNSNDYILEQIKVTFDYKNVETTYTLSQFNNIALDLGVLAADDEVEFDLKINLPTETSNDAQDANVNFDLRLEATQVLHEN